MKRIPRRYLIAILHFLGFFHFSALRINMSIAIVAMTSDRIVEDANGTQIYDGEFEWSSKEQGMVLASFFYGYITTQFIGGYLSPIVGAGRLFGFCILLAGVLNMITPTVAYYGYWPLIIVRALVGVSLGPITPTANEFWSHWAPPKESTNLLGIAFSGSPIGNFVISVTSGMVADKLGWSWIFYIFAISSFVWSLAWFSCVSEDPKEDKFISLEELKYITESQGKIERPNFKDAPWRKILTSVPLWSAMMAHTVSNSIFYTNLTQLPSYLNDVLGLDLKSLGLISCVPFMAMAFSVQFSGYLADLLRTKYNISTTTVRKIFLSGSFFIQTALLLVTPHVTSVAAIMTCITSTVGIGGFQTFCANIMEVAPQYAGLTMGLSNTIGTLPGMISPVITGFIVQNKLASEWEIVFYIAASVSLTGGILYSIFGSGEQQPWATKDLVASYDNPVEVTTTDEQAE